MRVRNVLFSIVALAAVDMDHGADLRLFVEEMSHRVLAHELDGQLYGALRER